MCCARPLTPACVTCRSNRGSKTRLERRGAPAFTSLVEVVGHSRWRIHRNVAASVDALLAGDQPRTELRSVCGDQMIIRFEGGTGKEPPTPPPPAWPPSVSGGSWLGDLCRTAEAWGL